MSTQNTIHLLGCGALAADLRRLTARLGISLVETFLPAGLHDRPDELRSRLQQAIVAAERDATCRRIIIAYGICGQGSIGLRAVRVPLVFPRVHDCIALFLGSDHAYRNEFSKYPGTFYYTAGWTMANEGEAGGDDQRVHVGSETMGSRALQHRFGADGAARVIAFFEGWKKNYQRAVFIDTGLSGKAQDAARSKAAAMARENGWVYEELPGDLSLLHRLLTAESSDDEVMVVPPGWLTVYSALRSGIDCAPAAADPQGEVVGEAEGTLREDGGDRGNTALNPGRTLRFGLGIDAGGTYTDSLVYDFAEEKILFKSKALTSKWDFAVGIGQTLDGLDQAMLARVELVAVSTTLATNAIVEGEGQKTGLILMNNAGPTCDTMVSHRPRRSVTGYIDIEGREVVPIDEDEVRSAVRDMIERDGVSALAVSGFAATINPLHELRIKAIVTEEFGLAVCCGHEFSDLLDFSVRAQTAVLNARIIPLMLRFFRDLQSLLGRRGIRAPIMVVKGDGTLMSAAMARERPVETILSGPAASVAGAKMLTGLADATVVDMGGTTTDIVELRRGEVAVRERGARVGGFFTHVRALDMQTAGLGGDSFIRWTKTGFDIGPRRVMPLVCAAAIDDAGVAAAVRHLGSKSYSRSGQTILLAMPGTIPIESLDAREAALLSLVRERTRTIDEAAEALGAASPRFLPVDGLLQRGVVVMSGLTPTDLLHFRGWYRKWQPETAVEAIGYLAGALGATAEALVEELFHQIGQRLAEELFHHVVLGQKGAGDSVGALSGGDGGRHPVAEHLLHCLLGRKSSESHFLRATFRQPIIGVGAPIGFFLPDAAKLFACQVVLPAHGDVANALGAITSHVTVRRRLTICPDGKGGFIVDGVCGAPRFTVLATAEQWAREKLRDAILIQARQAGTCGKEVAICVDDRIVKTSGGVPIFLERVLVGVLVGQPNPEVIGT